MKLHGTKVVCSLTALLETQREDHLHPGEKKERQTDRQTERERWRELGKLTDSFFTCECMGVCSMTYGSEYQNLTCKGSPKKEVEDVQV